MSEASPRIVPVVVVLPPRTLLLDVAGPLEVLRKASLVQDRVRFDVRYVGPSPEVASSVGLVLSAIAPLPDVLAPGTHVVVSGDASEPMAVPGRDSRDPPDDDERIVAWLRRSVRPGIVLVSICSGALLAARAGLLDGHECTTHFSCCDALAALAPTARVVENRLFVEDGERLSSADITAGIDAMSTSPRSSSIRPAPSRSRATSSSTSDVPAPIRRCRPGSRAATTSIRRSIACRTRSPRISARAWTLESLAAVAAASPRHLSRLFNAHAGMSNSRRSQPAAGRARARSSEPHPPRHGAGRRARRLRLLPPAPPRLGPAQRDRAPGGEKPPRIDRRRLRLPVAARAPAFMSIRAYILNNVQTTRQGAGTMSNTAPEAAA